MEDKNIKGPSIPKKIHLIWLGDQSKFSFDLNSLKRFAPNYEVKLWTEKDFDWDELLKIPYIKKSYDTKSWAFLSDYLRAKILYEEGGVYLDSDMKVLKFMEGLFSGKKLVLSFENTATLSMGFVASEPGHKFFRDLIAIYDSYKSGKMIMGNVIWDHVAKRNLGIKINGKYQEWDDFIVYEFRRISLVKPRFRKWKRDSQYLMHQHTISWVPKRYRSLFKLLIAITQKITILNKFYGLILIWPKKQMRKNYLIKK